MNCTQRRANTEKAVKRVDHILTECRRRDLDPLRVLQKAIRTHDQKQKRKDRNQ